MSDNDMSALALQVFKEIQIEMGQVPVQNKSIFPSRQKIWEGLAEMPADALLLGIAGDGLPLLLRLRDPRPGAILLASDRHTGKTDFLKMLIRAAECFNLGQDADFVTMTEYPSHFDDLDQTGRLLGVWPAYQDVSVDLLVEISNRIQYQDFDRPLVLMLDGFESILKMEQAVQDCLVNILTNGPRALVWPIVSMDSSMALKLPDWLSFFQTRIYGRIASPTAVEALTPLPGAPLQNLKPGSQFCLRQKSRWLKFWLPNLAL